MNGQLNVGYISHIVMIVSKLVHLMQTKKSPPSLCINFLYNIFLRTKIVLPNYVQSKLNVQSTKATQIHLQGGNFQTTIVYINILYKYIYECPHLKYFTLSLHSFNIHVSQDYQQRYLCLYTIYKKSDMATFLANHTLYIHRNLFQKFITNLLQFVLILFTQL